MSIPRVVVRNSICVGMTTECREEARYRSNNNQAWLRERKACRHNIRELNVSDAASSFDISKADWREASAYLTGVQAFIYGFPAIHYTKFRFGTVRQPQGAVSMPLNTLFHLPRLSDHNEQYGGSPMRDAVYSLAWLDLRAEPVVIHAPACGDRYVSVQLAEFYSDLFGYAGPSVNDGKAQTALVVGPDWSGETPAGVDAVYRSPTPCAFVVARVSTPGGADLPAALALQQNFQVKPLSNWKSNTPTPNVRDVLAPFPPSAPLADFHTMNAAMQENPPPARDEALLRQFAQVGLGPSLGSHWTISTTPPGVDWRARSRTARNCSPMWRSPEAIRRS